MPRAVRYRRWVFTLNNPEGALDTSGWAAAGVAACVWSLERAPTTGTLHYQGYMQFNRPVSLAALKRVVCNDSIHGEPAEGTHEECVRYCTKPESHVDGPWWFPDEATVRGRSQGSRTDLSSLAAAVQEGQSLAAVADLDPATYIRNYRGLAAFQALKFPPVDRERMKVICIHGPPGIGKSHWAYRTLNQALYTPIITETGSIWFDGYCGEEVVLLDDYTGQLPYSIFNRILDPYPYRAPVKGGSVSAQWRYVIVLTNVDPKDWYPPRFGQNRDFVDAVYRRIGYGDWSGKDPYRLYFHFDTREEMEAWVASRQPPNEEAEEPPSKVPSRAPTPVLPSP